MVVENYSYPFEKGNPSLFVIAGSPFQALCAIEAIKCFDVSDFKFLVCLSNWNRDDQVLRILSQYSVEYECVDRKDVLSIKGRLSILRPRHNRYKRVFVGDFRSLYLYYLALQYASNGSTIISLDDGNCNVSLLKGVYRLDLNNKISLLSYWFFNFVAKIRLINKNKYLYTIFYDIPTTRYYCYPNHLNNLKLTSLKTDKDSAGVYFIGTNTPSFSRALAIDISSFYQYLEEIFIIIRQRHAEERRVFVPHGADDDDNVRRLCARYGFVYDRPNTLVELYLLNLETPPKCVYGFTSTALFTIKKMFPYTRVVNIFHQGKYPHYESRKSISDYYSQHGIDTTTIFMK